jgi:hypothetical protein
MEETVRWSLIVSRETDRHARSNLGRASRRKEALSQFVERAVRKELLAQLIARIHARNAKVSRRVIEREIEEAVRAVRSTRARPRRRRAS